MTQDAPKDDAYELLDDTIVVYRDPRFNDPKFKAACQKLLQTYYQKIYVDLRAIHTLTSPEIGALVNLHQHAHKRGRVLRVLASPHLTTVLKNMSLNFLLEEAR